jgi:DNA modification methylase
MKPVALCEAAIMNSSRERQSVLDLFGGSGSTLIAAEKTKRAARLMELEPRYVDVIVRRWQEFTGLHAVLETTGDEFAAVAATRVG